MEETLHVRKSLFSLTTWFHKQLQRGMNLMNMFLQQLRIEAFHAARWTGSLPSSVDLSYMAPHGHFS